jgi:MFS family permease
MTPGTGRVFYGWIALAGTALTGLVSGGAFAGSYGVFLPVMCDDFGWSRTLVASGLGLGFLCFGLPSPLFGASVARFGARVNLVLGNLLLALCLAGMSLVQEVWHIYLLYSLAGVGAGFGGYIAGSTVANNWFAGKRSLAMGVVLASTGLGGFVFPLLTTVLISSFGWRMSWLALAGIVLIAACLIGGLILVRNRPEDMGQVPDGISVEPAREAGTTGYPPGNGQEPAGWQLRQALRQPTTWLIATFAMASNFAWGTMLSHQVAYIQDLGSSPMAAAMTMSVFSGLGIVGSLGFGTLALRFNMKHLATASLAIQLIAFCILLSTRNLALIYVYAVLFGISKGAVLTALPTFIGAYYGRARYAQILGIIVAFSSTVQAAGPAVAGAIYDATGTYTPDFVLLTALSLVGLICAFMARPPRLPQSTG